MRWGQMSMIAAAAILSGCWGGNGLDYDQGKPFLLQGTDNLTQIAQLTGPGAINETASVAVAGTDLGSMINFGEQTFFVFGDTFGTRASDAFGGGGGNWRSNALAYTTDTDPRDGIVFEGWITDEIGFALEPVPGEHEANGMGEVTKIPTYGFVVEDTMYLYFMSVHFWGEPGEWDANYSGLARSRDRGQTWEILEAPRWPGGSNFIQVAAYPVTEEGEEFIYFWAIEAGRFGGVQLMKVPATTQAVEDQSSYRYFAGTEDSGAPIWSPELAEAATVLEGTVGELSVVHSETLDRWLMTYTSDDNAVISEGITPWGPWSDPHTITTQAEHPGLYAPFMNPRFVSDDGKTIYFSMSLWGPYNVFWWSVDLVTETDVSGTSRSP